MNYTKPSANPLRDADGNDAASFTGVSVANNAGVDPEGPEDNFWAAELTVSGVGFPFGCSDFAPGVNNDCGSLLTDNSFNFGGTEYRIEVIWRTTNAQNQNVLIFALDKAISGDLTLHVDDLDFSWPTQLFPAAARPRPGPTPASTGRQTRRSRSGCRRRTSTRWTPPGRHSERGCAKDRADRHLRQGARRELGAGRQQLHGEGDAPRRRWDHQHPHRHGHGHRQRQGGDGDAERAGEAFQRHADGELHQAGQQLAAGRHGNDGGELLRAAGEERTWDAEAHIADAARRAHRRDGHGRFGDEPIGELDGAGGHGFGGGGGLRAALVRRRVGSGRPLGLDRARRDGRGHVRDGRGPLGGDGVPGTPGATVDWDHFGTCGSLMSYCRDRNEVQGPTELDFAYLADIGYELLDAATATEPEVYGYGAWARYSAWGAGVERELVHDRDRPVDRLRAGADAFGTAPTGRSHQALSRATSPGRARSSVSTSGAPSSRPSWATRVFAWTSQPWTARRPSSASRCRRAGRPARSGPPSLEYAIAVTSNAFSDQEGRVQGGFFGPAHEEMAGVLHDPSTAVNLLAGFGGTR